MVRDDGQVLEVAGLSFRPLHVLLGQGTRVVGFDELIERVWAPAHVGEETVTQRVRLLRQALGDDGRQPRYLRPVRGQGYHYAAGRASKTRWRRRSLSSHDDRVHCASPR